MFLALQISREKRHLNLAISGRRKRSSKRAKAIVPPSENRNIIDPGVVAPKIVKAPKTVTEPYIPKIEDSKKSEQPKLPPIEIKMITDGNEQKLTEDEKKTQE